MSRALIQGNRTKPMLDFFLVRLGFRQYYAKIHQGNRKSGDAATHFRLNLRL